MVFRWLMAFCILFSGPGLASPEKLSYIAPSQLAHTGRQMHTPGFWISRHPSPDQVIMTPQQIAAFNDHVRNDLGLTKDIFAVTQNFKTESLIDAFNKTLKDYTDKGYCTAEGGHDVAAYLEQARQNMNVSDVVLGMAPRYALVTHYADVRFFPMAEGLYGSSGDIDFDQVQNSSLDIGTPVAIVHQSADKQWFYVFSALSDGWVRAGDLAVGEQKTVQEFAQARDFVVATRPKADLYLDENMTDFDDYVRMGARLPLAGASIGRFKVQVPVLGKDNKLQITVGYIPGTDGHVGYLPYTARTIYTQAFAMLNQPYGWGGMYGEQDCSAFLDEVFATVGLALPRDSKDQAQVGTKLAEFEDNAPPAQKLAAFKQALPAAAILPMRGHILLYLGMARGQPYAIHSVWAYRQRAGGRDVPRVVNKVTVSDLTLGEGSQKGSLLKRLTKIVALD